MLKVGVPYQMICEGQCKVFVMQCGCNVECNKLGVMKI